MTDEECERLLQHAAEKLADRAMTLLSGSGAFEKPQPTALRLTASRRLEIVELREDGGVVELPRRCPRCGPFFSCAKHSGA